MTRRLLAGLAVAGAVASFAAPASAQSQPDCYGARAAGYDLAWCAGFVCDDLCYWVSYSECTQPQTSPANVCATWTKVLSLVG